ncbi:response regulator transcription factor [Candidatus Microgenomates bacterium]|nr:response regulator transcription factor [Candidatus Microgenomates bacterium]
MSGNILVVEDDIGLQKYLRELFVDNDFTIQIASRGTQAIEQVKNRQPDLVVLDLGLPDMDGESVCAQIRTDYPDLPVVILTARDALSDKVRGLNLGADDYITKPFQADELLARIKTRLRKTTTKDKLRVGDLELDTRTFEVKRGGNLIKLTPQEFKLLQYLMNNKGRILTREMILSRLWLAASDVQTRVVDVYMGYLRRKIDQDFKTRLLRSVRGFGYMIKE